MTGLFVRLLAVAIVDYWSTRRPQQRQHFLHMLATAFGPPCAGLLFSHVRRTKSLPVAIVVTGSVLVLGGLAIVLARRGPGTGKPARQRHKRTMHSRAPLKRVHDRGVPTKSKAGR
jgi:hypothetical protein